jgi:PKD repeat protein
MRTSGRKSTIGLLAASFTHLIVAGSARGQLIDVVDYSDTFTLGMNGRANGVCCTPGPYAVEDTHGNPPATWTPQTNFSFNDIPGSFGAGPVVLAAATGNPGAATGVAQSGGGDFSFAYGLRTNYVVEVDAFLSPGDRTDISSLPSPGAGIFAANSISIFFRRDSIAGTPHAAFPDTGLPGFGIFNGSVETAVLDAGGAIVRTGVNDDNWHRLAVHFNQNASRLGIYVDGNLKANLDLNTFGGGMYKNYSNAAVGCGGAGAFVDGKVLWFDNFKVGHPILYCDDFSRAGGAPGGWTIHRGDWRIDEGELVTGPTAGVEHWIWAGSPAISLPGQVTVSFDMRFLAPGNDAAVGRHGGAMLFASLATERTAPNNGYLIDWIDRAVDRGIRFTRITNGMGTLLVAGQGAMAPAEPPLRYRVVVDGPSIRVFGDDVLYIDIMESTYRGGHFGFWAWSGAEHMAFDDVKVTTPASTLVPCFQVTTAQRMAGCPIAFDAACSVSSPTEIVEYDWDFGGGAMASGPQVEHTFAMPGTYPVTLTVTNALGGTESSTQQVTVAEVVLAYADDFNRAAGPVTGLTVGQGTTWRLTGTELFAGPTTTEHFVWAGDPPVFAPGNAVFEFDYLFLAPGTFPAVGRHGGFQFHASRPTARLGAMAFSGYFIDWIDRPADRGIRLTRANNGVLTTVVPGQGAAAPAAPPLHYRVEVDGASIRVFGDGVKYIDFVDTAHRGGFFGFWAWEQGQEVLADDLTLDGEALFACFTPSRSTALPGDEITFDAACSRVFGCTSDIVSYCWDLGDGTESEETSVAHRYAAAGTYTVVLTVEDDAKAVSTMARTVTIVQNLVPFNDCFDSGPGPVTNWTSRLGTWSINAAGEVETDTRTTAGEAFLYAGSPPGVVRGDFKAEVDWEFVAGSHPDVGRHGAVHFFWNIPTTNRFAGDSSGYSLFYIDRAADRGLTLARFNGAAFAALNPPGGTPAIPDPPRRVRIEVEGPRIRVYADGVLAIEAMDNTHREGHFALWAWNTNHVRFDNVHIWRDVAPEHCASTRHLAGDCNGDGVRDITDVLCYVRQVFRGFFLLDRAVPPTVCAGGLQTGGNLALLNINGDATINVADIVYLARYLFASGPPPVQGAGCVAVHPDFGCAAGPTCK